MAELSSTISIVLKNKPVDIWSIAPAASVYEAVEMMAEKQVGALPVVEQGRLVGIFSERDYARKIILKGRSSKDTPVSDIMTANPITITPQHTVADCMRIVTDKRIRHLPVVEGGKLIGIVSIGDLVNWVISEQQETIKHLEAYISGIAS
ncbi:MAG TPA: CBS domain-containing protein [Pseudacidobacterium sp.]|jgi:CBS domain-containing protein|nr:CBS domain-containing protein [Pseudacidobacterium sp.]